MSNNFSEEPLKEGDQGFINFRNDEYFMRRAIAQSEMAASKDEVPIGAVIVKDGEIIAQAYNQQETLKDATAHAEIIALTQASTAVENWRLSDCTLYVTKEPCPMCAGALVNARIKRVVYGIHDQRCGGFSSFNIHQHDGLLHSFPIEGGLMEFDCLGILQDFFQRRRAEVKAQKKLNKAKD